MIKLQLNNLSQAEVERLHAAFCQAYLSTYCERLQREAETFKQEMPAGYGVCCGHCEYTQACRDISRAFLYLDMKVN